MYNKIYILHEYGANSHYRALDYLAKKNNTELVYREFSIVKNIIKAVVKFDLKLFTKQFINVYFLLNLIFTKNKKIVLGIAPYDFRLIFLSFILKNHKVYYHTSWTCWDKSYFPKKLFVTDWLIAFWERFLQENVIEIFTVTTQTKNELINNLNINEHKINVVYHSFDNKVFKYFNNENIGLNFVYVGRLVLEKGIDEILDYFISHQNINLSIVGNGPLLEKVKSHATKYKNIEYLGYITDQEELVEIYNQHNYLLLNSKKVGNWEELFGMVIIEAMACGVVPITTNHKGPIEIIKNKVDGYILSEKKYIKKLDMLIDNHSQNLYKNIQEQALNKAEKYTIKNISKKWENILNER